MSLRLIAIFSGSCMCFFAIFAIAGAIVAEYSIICRVVGVSSRIFSMSSMNPMSSISSASSRTTIEISARDSVFRFRWSSTRPGVPTTMFTPLLSAFTCRSSDEPP